jgi:hypothetical protein
MGKKFNDPSVAAGTPGAASRIPFFDGTTGELSYITLANFQALSGWSGGGGGDVTAPTVVSATVPNGAANTVVVVFSESVTATTAGWSFRRNTSNWAVSSVAGSGTTWTFTMATSAANGETIDRSYNSATGATVDAAANELVSFTNAAVTNSIAGSYDSDAQAYITAASVSAGAHSDAVDAFVTGLKSASLWTKMRAYYPLYGTAYSTSKFNLKDTANTDAAGRLTEFGSFTYAADGATMTTSVSGDRLSTNILDNDAFLGQNDICLFVASKTNVDELKIDIGSNSGATTALYMVTRTGGNFWGAAFCSPDQSAASSSSIGRFYLSRTASNAFAGYKNGSSIFAGTTASDTPPGNDISLFNISGGGLHSTKKLTAGGIFKGLTSGEISTLDGLISTFLTAIGHV